MRDDRDRFRLSATEAARYLDVSLPALYRLVERRELAHFRATPGGRLKFSEAGLEAYLAAHTTGPQPRPAPNYDGPSLADMMPASRRFQ